MPTVTTPVTPEIVANIKTANSVLLHARYAYYVESKPVMADKDYDALEKELRDLVASVGDPRLEKIATVLATVGSDIAGSLDTIKHRAPMLSLDNAYSQEDLDKVVATWPDEATFTIEPKVDGLSLSARYFKHRLLVGVTRGDGTIGEDVTLAAMTIDDLPKTLPISCPGDMEIRGEVFLTTARFNKINEDAIAAGEKTYANERNLASGTLKTKDIRKVAGRHLSFMPWQVIGLEPESGIVPDGNNPNVTQAMLLTAPSGLEHSQALEYLHRSCPGVRQQVGLRVWRKADLWSAIESARILKDTLWAQGLSMVCDGIVIKVEEEAYRKELGLSSDGRTPKWAVAYKFPSDRAVTTLNAVTWQVGRTGKLTPVAELEPVLVGGTVNRRGTLCNWTYLQNLNIQVGDKVSIFKGGEVIPQVEGLASPGENRVPVLNPSSCPACGHKVSEEMDPKSKIVSHHCVNATCKGRMIEHFTYIGKREVMDIDGLGEVLAEQFVTKDVAPSLGYLWQWGVEAERMCVEDQEGFEDACAGAGFSIAQIRTLIASLAKAKTAPWDKWLQGLGIPGVAKEMSRAIAAALLLQPEDLQTLPEKLLSLRAGMVDGIGPERMAQITLWALDPMVNQDLRLLWDAGVRPESTIKLTTGPQPLSGIILCLTGEFGTDRVHLGKQLESLGATIKGISKKLTLLVAGEGAGPSKLAKAAAMGIRVEGKEWVVQALKSGGLEIANTGMPSDEEMLDEL